MKYRIGVLQFKPELLAIQKNLLKMEKMLNEKAGKADLIVLPELAPSGYVFTSKDEAFSIGEDALSGPTASLFKTLASRHNTSYVIGFAEKSEGKLYNSSMLVNPDRSVKVYRKTHLFFEEKLWFQPGNTGFEPVEAKNNVLIGMMVCFDWIFPESARTLTLKGAKIICHPANLVLPWCQQAMITRSLENRVFTITSNRIGLEKNKDKEFYFTGQSQITDTKGNILHRMGDKEEGIFIDDVDPDESLQKDVTNFNNIIQDLRFDNYIYNQRLTDE